MVFQLLVIIISIIIIIIKHFFRRVFSDSECTEVNATSLIPLSAILPEICAFIIGFSCTVWTKTTSLACSLTGGVLAGAIFIIFVPFITAHHYKEGEGSSKRVWKLVTEKTFTSTVNEKRRCRDAKRFSKK